MRRASTGFFAGAAMIAAAAAITIAGTSAATAAEKKPVTIALFVAIQANPVEQAIINNFMEVAKTDGAAKFVVFDSNTSVQKEIANCNDAIASKKYDAFALKSVAGPPLMNCAKQAMKAGIPVVAFGNPLGPDPDTAKRQIPGLSGSVIELSKVNGIAIAELVNDACKAKKAKPCKVIYTYGPLAFDWASVSRKFFEQTVAAKFKNIKVVAEGSNNFDPNTARTLTKSLVQAHPDVDVIASDGDLGAEGVISGLKDLGKKPGKDILVTGGAFSEGVARIQQELARVPALSVLDNVFRGVEPGRAGVLDRTEQRTIFAALAARFGFTHASNVRVETMRVADQQKVEIMRALVRHARLIVMDEPTAALTRIEADRLLEIARDLRRDGVTVIYVSHVLADVLALADTVTVLKDGKHVKTVPAKGETVDSLVTAMLGRAMELVFPPRVPSRPNAPVLLAVKGLARAR